MKDMKKKKMHFHRRRKAAIGRNSSTFCKSIFCSFGKENFGGETVSTTQRGLRIFYGGCNSYLWP